MSLTSSQKRYLRGLAHNLKPVIMVGNKGISDALLAEFSIALDDHELIKVKLAGDDREERAAQISKLGDAILPATMRAQAQAVNAKSPRI